MAGNNAIQRRNSQKSGFRHLYGHRDTGQRYEVRYRDGLGTTRTYGFTESHDIAEQWCEAVDRNLIWDSPRIVDRKKGTSA